MTEFMDQFSIKLKEVRRNLNVTREKMATDIDTTVSTIYSYESGRRTPPIDYISRLINYYNLDPADLFNGKENVDYLVIIKYLEDKIKKLEQDR